MQKPERDLPPEPYALRFKPQMLDTYCAHEGAWHEDDATVRAGLKYGKRKAWLLAWVRARMKTHLKAREAHFVDLYYFQGRNQTDIGQRNGCHASTVCRVIQRAVEKLQHAAREDRSWEPHATDRIPAPPPKAVKLSTDTGDSV